MESNDKSNCNKNVKLKELISKLFQYLEWKCILVISIILLSIIILSTYGLNINFCEQQKSLMCQDFINVFSCLLGFSITGYAIILSSSDEIINKMCRPTCKEEQNTQNNPNNPHESKKDIVHFDILCATFTASCIFFMLTILFAIIYRGKPVNDEWLGFFYFVIWMGITSFLLALNIIFHLYTIASYRKNN